MGKIYKRDGRSDKHLVKRNNHRETLQNITFEYNKNSSDFDCSVDELVEKVTMGELGVNDYYLLIELIDKYDWRN